MEPTNDVREALAEAMADTLVRSNPGVAKDFCLKAGLDFDITVATYLAEAHEAGMCDHTLRQTLRQILELCTNRDWVITEAHQWPLTEHTIGFLAQVLPDVLTVRREELLDWLLSDEGRWMGEVRSFLSAGEVIGRLNQDPRIRNLPRAELAEKVEMVALWMSSPRAIQRTDSPYENPGLDAELWQANVVAEVLCYRDRLCQEQRPESFSALWNGLGHDERRIILQEAITSLMNAGEFTDAARLAEWGANEFPSDGFRGLEARVELDHLKVQAANAAYERCCRGVTGHQWLEAAELAEKWKLFDHHGAAAKWMKELEERGDSKAVVDWAEQHGLPVHHRNAMVYFRSRHQSGFDPFLAIELALGAGETEQVRKAIVELWQRGMRTQKHWDLLDHYRQPGGVFSGDDAIADLSVILAALGEQEAESQFLSLLETLGLADVKPAIVSQAVKEIISDRAKTEAERFVADHFPCSRAALSVTALSEIAERVAVEQARERDWRGFLRLCQEWELTTLLAIVADLEKFLPEDKRPAEPPGDRFARAAGISI